MDAQKRIKQLMEERGWTDYRLGKESGLSHSTVTNMLDHYTRPVGVKMGTVHGTVFADTRGKEAVFCEV